MPKRCFVIGPMSGPHAQTLNWLAFDVVQPLLPPDFVVETPDSRQIGNIMTQVIKACDRAQLVIANTTGNNPNVLYEIAVLDAMGRACIPVKIAEADDEKKDLMPFDRAAYRFFSISQSPDRRAETDRTLREAIEKALAIRAQGDMYQNPLTDFFGVPLSSFSSAYALARGYYYNLLKPTVTGLLNERLKGSAFEAQQYPQKALEVILPSHLGQTSRTNVERIVKNGQFVQKTKVAAPGREITLYEWKQQAPPRFRWMDIPTTMSLLRETVRGRRGRLANPDPNHPEYLEIEHDEIEKFQRALLGIMRRDLDADEARGMIRVVPWAETGLPQ